MPLNPTPTRPDHDFKTSLRLEPSSDPQLAEQGIAFSLHAGIRPGNHHRCDSRQGQVAITGKSVLVLAHLIN